MRVCTIPRPRKVTRLGKVTPSLPCVLGHCGGHTCRPRYASRGCAGGSGPRARCRRREPRGGADVEAARACARLCAGARLLERPDDLPRLLAEEPTREVQRFALELGSSTLDQRLELARGGLVREAIAPLIGALSEQGEVVVLADQIRQVVGSPGDALHLLRRGRPDDLRRVPEVLCTLA